jgi:ClpP class serine protease
MEQLWACEPEYLRLWAERVLLASEETERAAFLFFENREEKTQILNVDGATATIEIRGTLTNQPSLVGSFLRFRQTSFTDIQDAIATIAADDTIKTVRLIVDSPGGDVTGLDETRIALSDLAKTKEIIAENHGLMASGALWLATGAQKIIATSPAAETGSIGVRMLVIDFSEMDRRDGIKEIHIVSKNAPKKVPDVTTEEGLKVFQDRLDALERVFISRVAEGRNVSTEKVEKDFGQGGLLIAADPDASKPSALSVGLIDEVIGIIAGGKGKDRRSANEQVDKGEKKIEKEDKSKESSAAAVNGKGQRMLYKDLAESDPELKTEVDGMIKAAADKSDAEKTKVIEAVTAVLPVLSGDAPKYIKELAVKVIKGDATVAEMNAARGAYDQIEEEKKNKKAADESDEQGETPPETPTTSTDGVIRSEEDLQETAVRLRKQRGIQEEN